VGSERAKRREISLSPRNKKNRPVGGSLLN